MSRAVPALMNWSFPSREALDAAVKALIENPHVKELLPIRTCQRHELFALVLGDYLQSITEADSTCDGSDAATRLFAIAGGVLSDLPGERAVAEQVRNQLRLALKRRQAGSVLAKLARRALRSGEKLRDRVIETTPILELADLVTQFISGSSSRGLQPAGITLLGAGRVGKSLHAALQQRGLTIDCWATRHPRAVASGPNCSIEQALSQLHEHSILIVALGEGARPINADELPSSILTIDLSVPRAVTNSTMTLRDLIDQSQGLLERQRNAVERASHRLRARAEAALAETLSPSMAAINDTIARFRNAIIDAEYRRLAPQFEQMSAADAERMRRSIRHTAARCVHPIHEYVNALGRQSRVDEARTVVDHLLGTRVGVMIESECETRRRSPGIGVPGL
jgi:glutamyl-tRNA reductase